MVTNFHSTTLKALSRSESFEEAEAWLLDEGASLQPLCTESRRLEAGEREHLMGLASCLTPALPLEQSRSP